MERLSDDELREMHADNGLRGGDAYATAHEVRLLCEEVIERRAADVNADDIDTLKYLRGCAMAETRKTRIPDRDRAFKLIDRLLKGGGGKL